MAAEGRIEGLCDLSKVVASGHNEQWRPKAAKLATNLAKISPFGNTVKVFSSELTESRGDCGVGGGEDAFLYSVLTHKKYFGAI